jgi:hypothetical protein
MNENLSIIENNQKDEKRKTFLLSQLVEDIIFETINPNDS